MSQTHEGLPRRLPVYLLASVLGLVVLALCGCGAGTTVPASAGGGVSSPAAPTVSSIWAGAWGAAMSNAVPGPGNTGGEDESFRFLITPTLGGTEERVRFSNTFGTTPVTLGAARLAIGADGTPAIDPAHDLALSFNGAPGITIPAGQSVTSDPVELSFHLGQVLAVSLHLSGSFGPVSRHDSYRSRSASVRFT